MLALLPLLVSLAGNYGPTVAKMLLGEKAGDVIGTVIGVAKQVFGTDDPAAISTAAQANPDLITQYIEQLKAQTEQFKASLVDVEDARSQTVKLAEVGSVIAWGAPVVSSIVVVGFVILLALWLFHPPSSDPALLAVLNIMVGTLASAFGAVVQYWLGSSAGSKEKDQTLSAALVSAQSATATVIASK